MDLAAPQSTYSIPFRRSESTAGSLPAFIGDQANPVLQYLADPTRIRESDWPITLFGPPGTGKTELAHSVIRGMAPFGKKTDPDNRDRICPFLSFSDRDGLVV